MQVQKRVSVAGEWAKVKVDIINGDVVEILNEGASVPGEYGSREVFKVKTRNGEKNLTFNQTSINNLLDAYGGETKSWIGKKANATVIKMSVSGQFRDVVFLYGIGWVMNDDGSVSPVHGSSTASVGQPKTTPTTTANYDYPDEDINPDDISF